MSHTVILQKTNMFFPNVPNKLKRQHLKQQDKNKDSYYVC